MLITIVVIIVCGNVWADTELDKTPSPYKWMVFTKTDAFEGSKSTFAGVINKEWNASLRIWKPGEYHQDWQMVFMAPNNINGSKIEFRIDNNNIIRFEYDIPKSEGLFVRLSYEGDTHSRLAMFDIDGRLAIFPRINSSQKGIRLRRGADILSSKVNYKLDMLLAQIRKGKIIKVRYTELFGHQKTMTFILNGSNKAITKVLGY